MKKTIFLTLILIFTAVFSSAQKSPNNPKLQELDAKIRQTDAKLKQTKGILQRGRLEKELNALKEQRKQTTAQVGGGSAVNQPPTEQQTRIADSLSIVGKAVQYIYIAAIGIGIIGIFILIVPYRFNSP